LVFVVLQRFSATWTGSLIFFLAVLAEAEIVTRAKVGGKPFAGLY